MHSHYQKANVWCIILFFSPFLLFSLNLLQISLKVKQFSITGCQAYATVTSHFSWYQKQPSTRARSWNTAGSSTSPNSTEQVKKILTHHFKPVLLLSLLLWGGDWSHGEEGLCKGSPGSMGGGCCGYSMGWCMQTMQREIGVGVSVIKACFLENNFCFTWDILGLVLGINF